MIARVPTGYTRAAFDNDTRHIKAQHRGCAGRGRIPALPLHNVSPGHAGGFHPNQNIAGL
jgi:hypothetical protein